MARSVARRQVAAVDKRAAILRAALELFSERTFSGTPMPEVAARAQVGAGTIYRYFSSKEELANAVFRDCKLALQRCLAERAGSGGGAREEFHRLWIGLFAFARQEPAALRFLEQHHHERYLDDASRALSDSVALGTADFVRRAQGSGAIRRGAPALLIALAFGAFLGLLKESQQGRFTLDEVAIRSAEDAVWAMLAA